MSEDKNKIQEKFNNLPPEIKTLLYSPEMSFIIQQVGQKNKLHLDQIDALNTEAGQVMLGFTDPKDFSTLLAEMLHIDQAQAETVAKDVNDMLFSKIRESMKASSPQASTSPSAIPASSVPTPAPTAPPVKPSETHPADLMLNQKTVSIPASSSTPPIQTEQPVVPEPPKPSQYKTDPYREPPQ